jgi:hypothetical protein
MTEGRCNPAARGGTGEAQKGTRDMHVIEINKGIPATSPYKIGLRVFRYDFEGDLDPEVKKVHRITQLHVILADGERFTHRGKRIREPGDYLSYGAYIEPYTPEREQELQIARRRETIIDHVKDMDGASIQRVWALLRDTYGWPEVDEKGTHTMTNSPLEHSPAPWTYEGMVNVYDANGRNIVCTGDMEDCSWRDMCDASLIASAPDLLKACEAMHAWFKEEDRGRWPDPETLQSLRDAIGKAYVVTFAPED